MVTHERDANGHLERVTVLRCDSGWEVCEQHDDRVIRRARYSDWHRVERAVQVFKWRAHVKLAQR